jgi:monooxygenase
LLTHLCCVCCCIPVSGIRSDSDMYTLGYSFSPWTDRKMLADGSTILNYIKMTADKYDIQRFIRLGHGVKQVSWEDTTSEWTVTIERTGSSSSCTMRCKFLFICTGYYDYDHGHTPVFKGSDRFSGRIVHPQHWPRDLDYANKRVIVVGSGATAVTLVPAMVAAGVGHITMLQRSPTYVAALPPEDPFALLLLKFLPTSVAHFINRWKNIIFGQAFFLICKAFPKTVKKMVIWNITQYLGPEYEKHFTPKYDPWDQRFCVAPDGDLFKALKEKKASIVTDTIDTFTETGIKVNGSLEEIPADIIVTATGLKMKLCGGMKIVVNGETKEDMTQNFMYKV